METKEFEFKGFKISGFIALFLILAVIAVDIILFSKATHMSNPDLLIGLTIPITFLVILLLAIGMVKLEPNEARALVFFGKYRGTLRENGFWYINPLLSKKRVSLRARNFDAEAIKVNDKSGNPILIGLVLVWRVKDVYKSLFEIDSQTMSMQGSLSSTMKAFESFVKVQADAALRQVAGNYNYDEKADQPLHPGDSQFSAVQAVGRADPVRRVRSVEHVPEFVGEIRENLEADRRDDGQDRHGKGNLEVRGREEDSQQDPACRKRQRAQPHGLYGCS